MPTQNLLRLLVTVAGVYDEKRFDDSCMQIWKPQIKPQVVDTLDVHGCVKF